MRGGCPHQTFPAVGGGCRVDKGMLMADQRRYMACLNMPQRITHTATSHTYES